MRTVHVGLPDRTQSQYYEDQLHTLWQQGAIRQDALYWIEGMPEWRPIGEFFPGLPVQYPANMPMNAHVTPAMQPANPPPTSGPVLTQQPNYQPPNYQAPTMSQQHYQLPTTPPANYQQPGYGAPYATAPSPYGIYTAPQQALRMFVKDPTNLTTTLKVLLWTTLGFNGALLLAEIAKLMMQSDSSGTNGPSLMLAALTSLIAIGELIILLITAVHFCKWVHRANTNVRGFGAQGLEFTPGWAVGYFFVPIMSLFRPYQAMAEIWQASRSPAQWKAEPVSGVVGTWWGLYLLSNLCGGLASSLTVSAQTPSAQQEAALVSIVSYVLVIVSAVAAVNLVTKIYQLQHEFVSRQS